jgi:hypothetical protein
MGALRTRGGCKDRVDCADRSNECGRVEPTIRVDSSARTVTIARGGKPGNPLHLEQHFLDSPADYPATYACPCVPAILVLSWIAARNRGNARKQARVSVRDDSGPARAYGELAARATLVRRGQEPGQGWTNA